MRLVGVDRIGRFREERYRIASGRSVERYGRVRRARGAVGNWGKPLFRSGGYFGVHRLLLRKCIDELKENGLEDNNLTMYELNRRK